MDYLKGGDKMEFAIALLGTGIGAGIMAIIQLILNRKWAKEDRKEAKNDKFDKLDKQLEEMNRKLDTLTADMENLKIADKAILSDRIKYLCGKYLEDGEISFEDRRNLHDLHDAYHNHCGGNGDYDMLIKEIDELPLKRGQRNEEE